MIELSDSGLQAVQECRDFLDRKLSENPSLYYGINTGFGALCDVGISPDQIASLQKNLVLSHAAGTGPEVPDPVVRLMLLLKIHSLALGHSGIHPHTLERLIQFFNSNALPVLFEQGSLGASGDLAPLAHLALPLLGKGELRQGGSKRGSMDVLTEQGWETLELRSKEGLALLNGTQFMLAYGVYGWIWADRLMDWACALAALSFEAFGCRREPLLPPTHELRPHPGQVQIAALMLRWLDGSGFAEQDKTQVQDPYSFRCIPQVLGASRDTLDFVSPVLETEIGSVTDNPILFPQQDRILSGGNFHGQPLALALDYLGIALAELGNISERRTYLLLSGQRGLPAFLAPDPGLHSGLMIAQYTAASLVSQNKLLAAPASVDSISSSNGQEDHVSMGAHSATKLYRILENLSHILAIELIAGAQALNFRPAGKASPGLSRLHQAFRGKVAFLDADRELWIDIRQAREFLDQEEPGSFLDPGGSGSK